MNWFILEFPKKTNSENIINEEIRKKIEEFEKIINKFKGLITPH